MAAPEADEPVAGPSSAPHEGPSSPRSESSSLQPPHDVVEDDSTSGEAVLDMPSLDPL